MPTFSSFTISFSHLTVIRIWQYSTPDVFLVLYGEYSTDFCFDPPTQSSINIYKNNFKNVNLKNKVGGLIIAIKSKETRFRSCIS